MSKFTLYIILTLGCLFHNQLLSQTADSIVVENQVKAKPYGVFSMFKGKPGKAGLYSLILPGAGQAYNKKYWKVPLFVGAEAGAIALLLNNIEKYKDWDEAYQLMAKGEISEFRDITNIASLKTVRDSRRQSKDYAWIAVIAVHFITAADAFVDRHLIEFNIEDDIELGVNPTAPALGLSVVLSF